MKIALVVLLCLVLVLAVGITATIGWRPFIGPRSRPLTSHVFERTPERLARGKYLVEGVTPCMVCHSPHDWTKHDAPIISGMEGAGQDMSIIAGLPGRVVAPNLTPDPETGAGNWSDDALARAISEGIGRDGRTLFPMMPYQNFHDLQEEDLASIVVYLRSLPAVRNTLPATEIIFPVKYLIRSAPEPITSPVAAPDLSDQVKRGAYLVKMAVCADCHTPQSQGQPVAGMEFGGGEIFEGPWGKVATANLTSDSSGIPYYDEALFVQTMRTGSVKSRTLNQIMPWHFFRNMTDDDLKAVFTNLKTLKPVKHRVDNEEPPTLCKIDKTMHGGGDKN